MIRGRSSRTWRPRALKAIRAARATARERAWALAGDAAPGSDGAQVTVDLDATILIAHSEKEQAAPTWKRTFGFHPMTAFADHGPDESGEPLAIVLRPGNAGSNTAADHVEATRLALAQLPRHLRNRVLIRTDSVGGTHDFLTWLTRPARRLHYSAGFTITAEIQDAILKVPAAAWTPAYDSESEVRDGAWVAEITGMPGLSSWPKGMRVIIRKERPHPGAQLRFTDIDGHRFTAVATDTKGGSSRTWSCGTGGGPGARTPREASAARKRPGCGTCRCTAGRRTRSGARSPPWPASCSPGCRCSPSPAPPAAGNQNGSGSGSSPAPDGSSAAAACGSASPRPGPGPPASPPHTTACKHSRPADQPQPPQRPRKENTRACGAPPTRRDSRATRHIPALKNSHQPIPQASPARSRKIEASLRYSALIGS
jgi:hypothetical protein